jgi:FtsH-binding integral membrane protein
LLIQNPEDQQEQYKITLPIGAILLTQLFGLILTLVLPWNVRYHKYLPFKFNLWASAAYVLILVITLFSYLFFSKISESAELIKDFQVYFLAFFGFTCMLIYMQDLLFVCIAKNSTSYLISFIITVIVIICDYVIPQTRDAWFINDIIAVMIAGVVIKFVIIYKLKGSIAGLIVVWIFCIFRECLQFMSFLKFDQGFGVRLYPLFLQIPNFFNSHSTITCSAYGSSKVLRCFI